MENPLRKIFTQKDTYYNILITISFIKRSVHLVVPSVLLQNEDVFMCCSKIQWHFYRHKICFCKSFFFFFLSKIVVKIYLPFY